MNGDGFADLIVGAPFGNIGSPHAGDAFVIFDGNFTQAVFNVGTDAANLINSGPTGQIIFGAQGDDSLNGGADGDTIAVGGLRDDRALGDDGNETLFGGASADSLSGEASDDSLAGSAGNDSVDGGQGMDVLAGGDGADSLHGGGLSDALIGGKGRDVLTGGGGYNRFVFTAGSSSVGAADTITDFRHGFDKLVIQTEQDHGTFLAGHASPAEAASRCGGTRICINSRSAWRGTAGSTPATSPSTARRWPRSTPYCLSSPDTPSPSRLGRTSANHTGMQRVQSGSKPTSPARPAVDVIGEDEPFANVAFLAAARSTLPGVALEEPVGRR